MKNLFVAALFCIALPVSWSQSGRIFYVTLGTGSDDLRGGNTAYITFNLEDGSSTPEYLLCSGLGQNDVAPDIKIELRNFPPIQLSQLRSVTIRHDGRPKEAFQTYDNWDLLSLKISMYDEVNDAYPNVYNSANDRRRMDFVKRFTGDERLLTVFRQR